MPSVPSGNLYNTTGHLLTKTNRATLHWTGSRWVYKRKVGGRMTTRQVKAPVKPKRKYTRKIGPTRRGMFKGTSTNYANRIGRVFYKTSRGAYVIRQNNKSLYQHKARYYQGALIKSLANVPAAIRPKKAPVKKRTYRKNPLF
jgi:hypothetical protein